MGMIADKGWVTKCAFKMVSRTIHPIEKNRLMYTGQGCPLSGDRASQRITLFECVRHYQVPAGGCIPAIMALGI